MNNPFVLIVRILRGRCESTRTRVYGCLFLLACTLSASAQTRTTLAWTKKFGGSGSTQVKAMLTDGQGNIYLAGTTTSIDLGANGAYPTPRGNNLYRMGASTSELQPLQTALKGQVTAIGLGAGASGVAYVATTAGLMRSSDNGATWQVLTLPEFHPVLSIAVDPIDANVVYVAAPLLGVLESADGGRTWNRILGFDKLPSAENVVLDPSAPTTIYASGTVSTAKIYYRSDDGGKTWVWPGGGVSPIVPDASSPATLYGTARFTMERSLDRGATWQDLTLPNGCGEGQIVSDPVQRPNTYLVCGGNLYRSKDQGSTWEQLPVPASSSGVIAAAADPILPLLYATSSAGSIYRSSDGGDTWTVAARAAIYEASVIAAAGGSLYLGTYRDSDGFAAKLSTQGEIIWATYLGGSSDDSATSISLDTANNVYVAGITHSTNFPVTAGAYDGGMANGQAGYVVKLSPDGSQVVYSSRLKLNGDLNGLAVDSSGSAYVTGSTFQEIVTTPGVVDAETHEVPACYPLPPWACPTRAFLTKLTPSGGGLSYSTYLTGWPTLQEDRPYGEAVVVDRQRNATVAGSALWAVNASAGAFLYVTSVPGYGNNPSPARFHAAILDKNDNVIVGGVSGGELYTTAGVWKPWPDGDGDGFLAKYDANGRLVACTSMGAPVYSLALASDGSVIAGGPLGDASYYTRSMLQGPLSHYWFGRYSAGLSQLLFSSFVGSGGWGLTTVLVGGLPGASPLAIGQGQDQSITLFATETNESPAPRIDQIIDEASSFPEPVSPNERIIVYGAAFGASGARLLVGGVEAQIISQSSNTILATVPNSLGLNPSDVVVELNGEKSQSVPMPVTGFTGVLYRANPYPDPQALVLNQDGTLNSQANPAPQGSVIAVAVNGPGSYTLSGASLIFDAPPHVLINDQTADGVDANLLPAPGLAGLVPFLKVRVPDLSVTAPTSVYLQVSPPAGAPIPGVLSIWIK